MSDRELKLSVVLNAVDRITAPIRRAIDGTNRLAQASKSAKEEIKKLGDQQALISKYKNTNRSIGINTNDLKKAQQEVANIKARWENSADTVPMSVAKRLDKATQKVINLKGAITRLNETKETLRGNLEAIGVNVAETGALSRGYADLTTKIKVQNEALAVHQARLQSVSEHQNKLNRLQYAQKYTREKIQGAAMGIAGMAVSAAAAAVPVVQAARFETAMLGVAKQVEGARDESGQLTQVYYDMFRQVQMLGRELPMATSEIAAMVAAGARMGIARDELIAFTRTSAQMADAFELPAAELADQMGKIAGLFKIPIPRVAELADVINYLDDNAISKGAEIIDVLKRIGGTAEFLKMPANEAAALASTFLTLGSSAEIAGTAANAVMRELSIATMQPKRFKEGLAAIKLDAKKLQADMSKDATGTIQKVLTALNALPEERRLTVATQLFGKEYGDDVAKLAGGIEEYRRQLALARSEQAKGSMGREAAARNATTAAQWERTKNLFSELAVNIGSVLLPVANTLLEWVRDITGWVADFVKENQWLVKTIAYIVMAFGALFVAVKAIQLVFWGGMWAFNAFRIGLANIGLYVNLARGLIGEFSTWLTGFFTRLGAMGWKGVGEAIVNGIWSGLQSGWGWLVTKLQGLTAMLPAAVKNVLGIKSPSRVFAELGNYTMEGFGIGLTDGQRGTLATMNRIMAGITAAGAISLSPAAMASTSALPIKAGGQGAAVYQGSTIQITINPSPGMDESMLADLVARKIEEIERRRGSAARSSLRDRD